MGTYMGCDKVQIQLNNHEIYRTQADLQTAIYDIDRHIMSLKDILFGLVCGNPKDLLDNTDCEGNSVSPIESVSCKFKEIFEDEFCGLEYLIEHRLKLQYILDNWDNRWDESSGYGLTNNN